MFYDKASGDIKIEKGGEAGKAEKKIIRGMDDLEKEKAALMKEMHMEEGKEGEGFNEDF